MHLASITWLIALGSTLFTPALANIVKANDRVEAQQCEGIRRFDSSPSESYIQTRIRHEDRGFNLNLAVFEPLDFFNFGVVDSKGFTHYFCNDEAIKSKVCNDTVKGTFLFPPKVNTLYNKVITVSDTEDFIEKTNITRKGYYCVYILNPNSDQKFTASIDFHNPFGQLSAADYPKLFFYFLLIIIYSVILTIWTSLLLKYRAEILPVQKYISALLPLLIVENVMQWLYFLLSNRQGVSPASTSVMIIVAILSALRNSLSLFLLLIVCMGFSVVKQSLGKAMTKARVLALFHGFFGVIFAVCSMKVDPDRASGFILLLVIIPLGITLSIFYVWTLSSLSTTIADLTKRQQTVKALMYRRLWRILFCSLLSILAFLLINALVYSPANLGVPWQFKWFLIDLWLQATYLIMICAILYLWRPTSDNRRFAMSEQLAQDDTDAFEIDDSNIDTLYDLQDYQGESKLNQTQEGFRNSRDSFDSLPENQVDETSKKYNMHSKAGKKYEDIRSSKASYKHSENQQLFDVDENASDEDASSESRSKAKDN